MAGGLAQAIGLGYGGNPQRTDGTDRFREEFARGQAIQANRAAAKANAEAEKRKSVEAVMKDMAVTTDMTPFFQREFTRRQAERIAALNDIYMNPGANSAVSAANMLREFKDDLGYYTNASKAARADLSKIEDAKKNGADFFVSNNPITVGDSRYNHVYDALDQSQLADNEEGLSEIVKQATVPGEWSYGRDNKGRSVINSTLNLTTVDPVALADKYVKKEDYSVYGDKPRQVVKGPFGEQRYVYDTMIAPDRADVISKEMSTNPNVVKYYGLEEWKRRKAENPSLTFQEFASDQEAMQSIEKSVPTNVQGILQAKRGNETLDGRPRVSRSSGGKGYEEKFNPRKYAETESGRYGIVINQGVSDSQMRDWPIPENAKVLDGKGRMRNLIDDRRDETKAFRGSSARGTVSGIMWNALDNTVYVPINTVRNLEDPTDKSAQATGSKLFIPLTEEILAEYASITIRGRDNVLEELQGAIPQGYDITIGSDGIVKAVHDEGKPMMNDNKSAGSGVSSQPKPTKTGAGGL